MRKASTSSTRSGDQIVESELARVQYPGQSVREDVGVVPVVETPFQLLQVAVQMLRAHLVESSDYGTLEQAPDALDSVGMNVSNNPLLGGVIYHLVARVLISNPQVGLQFIGVDGFGFIFDGAVDEVMQGVPPDIGDALDTDVPAAL